MSEIGLDAFNEIGLDAFEEAEVQPEKALSHSAIGAFVRCGMVYYWRYIKGVKSPPASAMSFGTSIHAALETNYEQKIHSFKDLPTDVVTDAFRDSWKEAAKGSIFDPEKEENPGEMLDEGVMMVEKYQSEVAPKIQPAAVESRFILKVPGLRRAVMGYIDLIDTNDVVSDHKTSRKVPDSLTLQKSHQLTIYKMAFRQKHGRDPRGLRYDYLVRKSSKKTGKWVEIHPMPVSRSESHEKLFIDTAKTVSNAIDAALFHPNPDTFICSPMGCGYWSRCMGRVLAGEKLEALDEIHQMQLDAKVKGF